MIACIDTETHRFRSGWMTPRMVCMTVSTYACWEDDLASVVDLVREDVGEEHVVQRTVEPPGGPRIAYLLDRRGAKALWRVLVSKRWAMAFHNASFDIRVMLNEIPDLTDQVLQSVEDGLVWDTSIRERLMAVAVGQLKRRIDPFTGEVSDSRFSLAYTVANYFRDIDLREEKSDPNAWRLKYDELDGIALSQWPEPAVLYALMDAVYPLIVLEAQDLAHPPELAGHATRSREPVGPATDICPGGLTRFAGETHRTRAELPLGGGAAWGIIANPKSVDKTEATWRKLSEASIEIGMRLGFVRPATPKTNTKILRNLLETAYRSRPAPRTSKGEISTRVKVLRESGDPVLVAYANAKGDEKVRIGIEAGFVAMKHSRDLSLLRKMISEAYGDIPLEIPPRKPGAPENPWYSDSGKLSYKTDMIRESGHPELVEYAKGLASTSHLDKYLRGLRNATTHPATYGVDSMKASGRCSIYSPRDSSTPFHQPPREGGYRECYEPRPGWVYVSSDYAQAELRALAQLQHWWGLGEGLRQMFLDGIDPLADMGAQLLNAQGVEPPKVVVDGVIEQSFVWDARLVNDARKEKLGDEYVKVAEDARQTGKAAMYGLPGGLGAATFVSFARGRGAIIDLDDSKLVKKTWLKKPENRKYLEKFSALSENRKRFTIAQAVTGRIRGGCSYSSGANGFFQGLVADGFLHAAWLIFRETVTDKGTALFGCRLVLPLHDEFVIEAPRGVASQAARRLEELMIEGMAEFIPDVPVEAEAAISEIWSKNAKPVRGPDGQLKIWRPDPKSDREEEIVQRHQKASGEDFGSLTMAGAA